MTSLGSKDVREAGRDEKVIALVREIHGVLKRGEATEDHGLIGNLRCILDSVLSIKHPMPDPFASSSSQEFTVRVCEELFGCFIAPMYNEDDGNTYICSCCDARININEWLIAPHADDCIINQVRDYLAVHKPEVVTPVSLKGKGATP